MTDEELGILMATNVIGWHKNLYYDEWLDMNGIRTVSPSGYFAPAIYNNDMMTVFLKALGDGYQFEISHDCPEEFYVAVYTVSRDLADEARESTLPRAMCMALARAYEVTP
jgi:hypothetical protein